MIRSVLALILFLPIFGFSQPFTDENQSQLAKQERDQSDYLAYHRTIAEAEKLIAGQKYEDALASYKRVFATYDFVFSRDYKVATQLALYAGHTDDAFRYLKKGIAGGWTLKSIKKNEFLKPLKRHAEWRNIENQYAALREIHRQKINPAIRAVVKKMFNKDQRKAFRALIMFSAKGQERYAEKKFAPHSEKQLAKLNEIIKTHAYPGERLIGNSYWASVILSHHNSISERHTLSDTLYPNTRPKLLQAVEFGQLSPHEFARIDDWYRVIKSGHKEKAYGFLQNTLTATEKDSANQLRARIGLSSVETTNGLIAIQQKIGVNFYLPSGLAGKITIND